MSAISGVLGRARQVWRTRRLLIVAVLAGAFAIVGGVAYAYFTINSTNAQGSAITAVLKDPTLPAALSNNDGSITVQWTPATGQLTGAQYEVTRTTGPGSPTTVCANVTPPALPSLPTCTDTGLTPRTTYGYTVQATLGTHWVSPGVTASVQTVTPAFVFTLSGSSPYTAGSPITILSMTAEVGGTTDAAYTGTKTIDWSGLMSTTATLPTYPGSSVPAGSGQSTVSFAAGVGTVTGLTFTPVGAGSNQLIATDHALPVVFGSTGGFTVSPGAASKLVFTQPPTGGVTEGTPLPTQPQVSVEDSVGNVVTTATGAVTLAIHGYTAGNGGTAQGTLACTNSGFPTVTATGGVVNFTGCNITGPAAAGTYTLTASLTGGLTTTVFPSFTIVADTAAKLALSAGSTTPAAGAADNLTITAQDSFGNTVTSYTGDKSLTFGGAGSVGSNNPTVSNKTGAAVNFGTSETITFIAGQATVSGSNNGVMKLYKAETALISVTDGALTSNNLSVTVSAGSAMSLSLSAASTTPTAGAADNLTITAKDSFGNTATTYTGDKSLTFSGAGSVGSNNPTVSNKTGTAVNFGTSDTITFSAGQATVSGSNNGVMKLYKAETASISVTDATLTSNSLSVTVSAGSAASLSLSAGSATPAAGAADNLTITAKDSFGNTATSYTGDESLTFGGAGSVGGNSPTVSDKSGAAVSFGTSETITFSAGQATVSGSNNGVMKLYKAETASISVTDGTLTSNSLSVTVSAGTASQLLISPSPNPASTSATTNVTLALQTADQYGNPKAVASNTTFAFSDTGSSGKFATTSGAGGANTLSVTINSGSSTGTTFYGDATAQTATITAKVSSVTWGTATVTTNAPPSATSVASVVGNVAAGGSLVTPTNITPSNGAVYLVFAGHTSTTGGDSASLTATGSMTVLGGAPVNSVVNGAVYGWVWEVDGTGATAGKITVTFTKANSKTGVTSDVLQVEKLAGVSAPYYEGSGTTSTGTMSAAGNTATLGGPTSPVTGDAELAFVYLAGDTSPSDTGWATGSGFSSVAGSYQHSGGPDTGFGTVVGLSAQSKSSAIYGSGANWPANADAFVGIQMELSP